MHHHLTGIRLGTRVKLVFDPSQSVDALRVSCVESKKTASGIKVLSDNRSAGHHYYLSDRMEAGIALVGTEVKSAKDGMIQLKDAFGEVAGKEAWLVNAHISHYSHGNRMNHEVVRRRKLLLHRKEIDKLEMQTREKGLTVVPTKIYLKNGKVKVELAIGRGKKLHDKRESEREREMDAEARAGMRRRSKE